MPEKPEKSREIRVALVLYGGVSLAVYENGVTRCFHDLVRGRGVFGILLDLLDASAVVDVVAGTSAGGINGLFLAAALESGSEFAPLADLWRRLGDLGTLLRDPGHAGDAEALLDGQYFHDELILAFEKVCKVGDPTYRSPGEMDVFVTGTDLDGHARRYRDSLGNEIADKEHRVVFHLQHRPDRKSLGVPAAKRKVDSASQAKILGTIGRITASFPVGFAPVRGSALDEAVRTALDQTSEVGPADGPFAGVRSFVDGGVLDNKPFGPALRAIFHRMPDGVVDRRLFYVEPDPEPFAGKPDDSTARPPLAVGVAALTSIPGHEGIGDDLERLLEHNQRVDWLIRLKKDLSEDLRPRLAEPYHLSAQYISTRIECAARSLVLDTDAAPSVNDYPRDASRENLLEELREELKTRVDNNLERLNPFDVTFHLRRAFHLLYEFYGVLESGKVLPGTRTAMRLMGRIVKALKLVRDSMVTLRDGLVAEALGEGADGDAAGKLLDGCIRLLASDATQWAPIEACLKKPIKLAEYDHREEEFLCSVDLTSVAEAVRDLRPGFLPEPTSSRTILDMLGDAARQIVVAYDGGDGRFRLCERLDAELYPLEFTSGVYELDKMEFVRISPADAKIGLADKPANEKVTGDQLAHFSAFLRRDWRSNDILQGRLDGICQIFQSLLDGPALEKVLARAGSSRCLFDPEKLSAKLPRCPQDRLQEVGASWAALVKAWTDSPNLKKGAPKTWTPAVEAAAKRFREQLILAGQEDAFNEEIGTVYEDLHYQEVKFGRRLGPRGVKAGAAEGLIEADARKAAAEDLAALPPEKRWQAYSDMRIGLQDIVGAHGHVPNNVVGEYVTLLYLRFWGMLHRSLGARAASFLDRPRIKLFFRTPVWLIYKWLSLLRRDRPTAANVIVLLIGGLLGIGGTAWYCDRRWISVAAAAVLLVSMILINWVLRTDPERSASKT